MAKKKLSHFDSWFLRQFGALPMTPHKRGAMIQRADELRYALGHLEADLRADGTLLREYRAASYAWQITEQQKKDGIA